MSAIIHKAAVPGARQKIDGHFSPNEIESLGRVRAERQRHVPTTAGQVDWPQSGPGHLRRAELLKRLSKPSSKEELLDAEVASLKKTIISMNDTIRSLLSAQSKVQSVSVIDDVLAALDLKPDAVDDNIEIPESVADALASDE